MTINLTGSHKENNFKVLQINFKSKTNCGRCDKKEWEGGKIDDIMNSRKRFFGSYVNGKNSLISFSHVRKVDRGAKMPTE